MRVVLAGNPNCGKTTLFNTLTGASAHVGNWPGVTVEHREGVYKHKGEEGEREITIIDLPGIYSLSPRSPEEMLAREYIIQQKPELIINIVDVTNLERNLYLTTQLLEMDVPIILALNMIDMLRRSNCRLDIPALERALGVPAVAISALHAEGVSALMTRACELASTERSGASVLAATNFWQYIQPLADTLKGAESPVFHAVKLFEGDEVISALFSSDNPPLVEAAREAAAKAQAQEDVEHGGIQDSVALERYKYIAEQCSTAISSVDAQGAVNRSEKIDRLLTHKILGLPIFALFMLLVFNFTFGNNFLFVTGLPSPGVWMLSATEWLTGVISEYTGSMLAIWGAPDWFCGLVLDGLLAGLGAVLSFLPQIMLLFLFLAIMEDSGYMPRAAFMMDRLLRLFGLSGKAFMPMLMGFGCTVPAILATRTLESEKDRRLTIMLLTGFSCGAKLPIWLLFAAALFPNNTDLMVFGIYFLGVVSAVLSGFVLKNTLFRSGSAPFVMELPPYRFPKTSNISAVLWQNMKDYLTRAATIIAAAVVVIWALSNFSFSLQMVEPGSQASVLGIVGGFLTPLFEPLGFASGPEGWKAVVSILTGLLSKETVVATLGVLNNTGGELTTAIAAAFTPASALSFMAFNLLCVPCMAAVAVARAELKSAKWFAITIGFWLVLSYVVALLCYWGGTLLGF